MMEFEKAIEDAETLFLFDRRSQQLLQEMADEAPSNSRDRYLIRLTQAAFAYYNSAESQQLDISRIIRQATGILQEVKRFREDRVFFTMALRLEVDLLMHQSGLQYMAARETQKSSNIYNDQDARALSICETLLKNFPVTFEPLPSAWYSGVIPLFPIYKDQTVMFYKDRVQEHRMVPLAEILERIKEELTLASGIIRAKKFIAENNVVVSSQEKVEKFLIANIYNIERFVARNIPQAVHIATDIAPPRGIGHSQLEAAMKTANLQIAQARKEKDFRKYTGHLLQLGILNFLEDNPEDTVSALIRTLKSSSQLRPEDKQLRQYQHDTFPDIPFMLGTSYLKALLSQRQSVEFRHGLLSNGISGLMRALVLQKGYHQAYINLLVAFHYLDDMNQRDTLFKMYLETFDHDLSKLNNQAFRNLAFLDHQANGEMLNPEIVQWVLLAEFCTGGELTKVRQMLQELKTLYILNAHEYSIAYLDTYRTALRLKDEEFIKDLESNEVHSALLFYISHAFTSLSLLQSKNSGELLIDYANLEQSIELNSEALYFNPQNGSAMRLVETQTQILKFAFQRSQKRWENINNTMGQRFQFYEDYLRQDKCLSQLQDRMGTLGMADKIPDIRVSKPVAARMVDVITEEQRDRLRHRVEAT